MTLAVVLWSIQAANAQPVVDCNAIENGSAQLQWAFPITEYLSGYGETMIDYNFNQTTVGIGIALTEW